MGKKALARLMEGNKRFVQGMQSIDCMISVSKMQELAIHGQQPGAVILTCSDSRAPAEIIFDVGFGELFVIRVAGNVVAPSLIASMEFAVSNFGCPILMVLGHTQCGAVQSTLYYEEHAHEAPPSKNLVDLVGRIQPAVKSAVKHNSGDILSTAILNNIQTSIKNIKAESAIIKKMVDENKLLLVGALLDIKTGRVTLCEDIVS